MKTIHPDLLKRKIIHIDMDAFYASVEMREHPEYRGRPLGVGGQPKGRGVLCTSNYEARKFGIHSAMSSKKAIQLCPDLIIVPPRFELYKSISQEIRNIFQYYTPLIEPVSLDEAYLDVSNCSESATSIASDIKEEIKKQTQLTASAGVAPNKMLAKIASDLQKPDGLTIIKPGQVQEFMQNLPVSKIPGVGPVSTRKLGQKDILRCSNIYQYRKLNLYQFFGKRFTDWLWDRGLGIDRSEVCNSGKRKSISVETTFDQDRDDSSAINMTLKNLSTDLSKRINNNKIVAGSISTKVKYRDFSVVSKTITPPFPIFRDEDILKYATICFKKLNSNSPIRLIGIKAASLMDKEETGNMVQGSLF